MKTSGNTAERVATIGLCFALAQLGLGTAFAADADTSSTTAAAPKTHVLFMGANISVEKNKAFYPVADVTPTALLIEMDGKQVQVPQSGGVNLLINESLKLAVASVDVANLEAERAYAPGSDPFRKVAQSAALAAGETAVADLAHGEVMQADTQVMGAHIVLNAVRGTPNEWMGQAAVAEAEGKQLEAQTKMTQIYNTPTTQTADVSARAAEASSELSQELFDAIRLSFEVTADRDLKQPYYAVIAQIRERDAKPGHVRKWAYVKTLGTMQAGEKTSVTVYQGGLPRGYILEGTEVHLYDRGQELATNLSRKRVPLTDDEAMDFRIIEYVGANKGRTLPAMPAITALSGDVRATVTPAQLAQKCYVRVAKDGRVTATFRDAAGKKPLEDPVLDSALKSVRFNPALQAGKPVESIVAFNLGELATS